MSSGAALQAIELQKIYSSRKVVDGISFLVNPGEIVALLGPNGAGKTTSFDIVVGLVKADAGEVMLGEKNITKLKIHERSKLGIGYLTQEPSAFRNLTTRENLELVLEIQGLNKEQIRTKSDEILAEFNISKLADSLAISLSGGERRRLEIARVLVTDPKFILLDEPFTGIDPIAIEDIQQIIKDLCKKKNIGLLITDHNPAATLSITDRAYIITDGKIIREGSSNDIANDPVVRKYYLGESFRLG